jgi:SsrA-binding protein
MYFKKALIKIELGLGKGKKKFDKRAEMKKKVEKREEERFFKYKR